MSDEHDAPGDDGHGDEGHTHREESMRDHVDSYVANWSGFRGSLWEKLTLTAKNRAKAYTVGRGCCGHPGEPGC